MPTLAQCTGQGGTRVPRLLGALLAVALLLAPRGAFGSARPSAQINWPKFHLDLANTGFNPYETQIGVGNVSTLVSAWTARAGGVRGTPALWRGTVYVDGNEEQNYVSAVDAATGSDIWSRKVGLYGALAGVAYWRGALYVGTDDYTFHSLDARTGAERWSAILGGIPGNAATLRGTVYVASNNGILHALDAATGSEIWGALIDSTAFGTPAVVKGIVYEGFFDQRLYAFDASTGTVIWSYKTAGRLDGSSAVVSGGLVYAASGDMYLYAIDAATGTLAWKASLGTLRYSTPPTPAIANGVIYASGNGVVQAFDATDGTPLWSQPIADYAGSPVVANGVLYVTDGLADSLHALDAATGTELWSFTAGNIVHDPVVANGMVYAGSEDGNLYAFELPG